MRCLVIGASGYVGSRLVGALLEAGHEVRCLSRDPGRLDDAPFRRRVEVLAGDVVSGAGLADAARKIDVVHYLVHSLAERPFASRDAEGARNIAEAAAAAGVGRLVYLGGLRPPPGDDVSEHLASRAEVGEILLAGEVPAVVLQAAVIIGAGSASFEIIRHLTDRMPLTLTPGWATNLTQPIAIADVLHYLVACLTLPTELNRTFDIGGPDVLTYWQMMQRYARIAGLPRRIALPVAFLPGDLAARWIAGMTPVSRELARPLLDSLRHELLCSENDIAAYVPAPPRGLLDYEASVRNALAPGPGAHESDPVDPVDPVDPARTMRTDPPGSGVGAYSQCWESISEAGAAELWQVVEGLGGDNGWHTLPLAFELRGWIDQLFGGVGAHRGRRDADCLRPGETVDFWRVELLEPGRRLRLRAEMKMPGAAWLTLTVSARAQGGATLRLHVRFTPSGFAGHAYWWLQRPAHDAVFAAMSRGITRTADQAAGNPETSGGL